MRSTRITAIGLGSLWIALGCDGLFVLGDEIAADSSGTGGGMNGGSSGMADSGGTLNGNGETGGDGEAGGDGETGGTGAGGGTGAVGGTGVTGGGATGGDGGTGNTGPMGGAGSTGGDTLLELPDCGRTSLPMSDGPDAIATPGDPSNGVTGDFNHDSALDLATADYGGTVSVFFGEGDGSFSSSNSYATGLGKFTDGWGSIVTADLDGNGELDLVTTLATRAVSVLLGAPDGRFDTAVTYEVPFDTRSVAVGDWTGDQIADLVVAGTTGDEAAFVSVLEGHGDGSFASATPLWSGSHTRAIAAADLDADNHLDLVVSGLQGVTVLQGDGLGDYSNVDEYARDGGIGVNVADFNRDDVLDIAVESECYAEVSHGLTLFLGNGDGTFEDSGFHPTIGCPDPVAAAADVDGDDVPDMVGAARSVMLSDGNGAFQPELIAGSSTLAGRLIGLGDFDTDGKLDIATAATGWLAVRMGRGDGTFRSGPVIEPREDYPTYELEVADLDGNDTPDIVATREWGIDVLLGAGDGAFSAPFAHPMGEFLVGLYAVDFNRDGYPDLATLDLDEGVSVLLANEPGEYEAPVRYFTGDSATALQVGDVDADGIVDFVVIDQITAHISVLIGEGDGSFVELPDQIATGRPVAAALFDANGDDRLDLVFTNEDPTAINVFFGQNDGTFMPGPETVLVPGTETPNNVWAWGLLEFGQLDADNLPDLVVRFSNDPYRVLLSNGDGSFRPIASPDMRAAHARIIDFDQDGKNDIVSTPFDSGPISYLSVVRGNGDGSFACKEEFGVWGTALGFDIADVDADGRVEGVIWTTDGISVLPDLPR